MTQKTPAQKINELRAEMAKRGLGGFLVPREDEFMGEYVPDCGNRLEWLTGFSGSSGIAVVLNDKAAVFTDSRYKLQVVRETDPAVFQTVIAESRKDVDEWIVKNGSSTSSVIGYDPRLHTGNDVARMSKALKAAGMTLAPVDSNVVDAIWANKPAFPADPVIVYPEALAGRSAADKRDATADAVKKAGGRAFVLTQPDSIAWMLNIRGNDVPHTPFALSSAIIHDNGDVDWFIEPQKIDATVASHLGNHVRVRPPVELEQALKDLAQAGGKPVMVDGARSPIWFKQVLDKAGATVENMDDPCIIPKACKTPQEQAAMKDAHVRDGVAMARFLKWIDDEAPKGNLTELDIMDRLEQFRRMDKGLRDTSFTTIAGWAENGAVVHYRATVDTNKTVTPPGILLIDSGGQYMEGTTDITRTVTVGEPTAEMKDRFTRVLIGHIRLAMFRFADNTVGAAADARAREALWEAGLNYGHGTGHGVGCYLSVHEEAARISQGGSTKFRPGMVISNEPGYYKEGAYGIRIENLVMVREDGDLEGGGKRLAFDTITLAPIDRRLIDLSLMRDEEVQWLNDYHERVAQTISPLVEPAVAAWLKQSCAPLKKSSPVVTLKNGPSPQP